MWLFTDDAILFVEAKDKEDCDELQRDLDKIWDESKIWKIKFIMKKCSMIKFGKSSKQVTDN